MDSESLRLRSQRRSDLEEGTLTDERVPQQLVAMSKQRDIQALLNLGGVFGLGEKLTSNLEEGILGTDEDILRRKIVYGANIYPQKKRKSFWRFLWEACWNVAFMILIVADMVSLFLGIKIEGKKEGWHDGGSIFLAVILVAIVAAICDYIKLEDVNKDRRNICMEVIRGGRRVEISISDIVVGDVIPLKIGDQVPADGVLISGQSLAIDESIVTGSNNVVMVSESLYLKAGGKVADGYGTMLVISVGINTLWGVMEDTCEETPLQVRLNGLTTFVGRAGLLAASILLAVLLVRYFVGHTTNLNGSPQFQAGKTSYIQAIYGANKIITIAATIVVVARRKVLLLAFNSMLAYIMRGMMKDKALFRKLSACETMGSVTAICCAKSGTLTENKMAVVEVHANGQTFDSPNNGSLLPHSSSLLMEGIAQNTVYLPEGGGCRSLTDEAMISWAVKLGMNLDEKRSESTIISSFPFKSEKQRGGVALSISGSIVNVHWKGAAEIVLASCVSYMDENDSVAALDERKVASLKNVIEGMAEQGLCCVALAFRSYEANDMPSQTLLGENLILLAIVGIKDPCRPGVRDSVELCKAANIKVLMVTGDNLLAAKAIALECGILDSDADAHEPNLIEGRSFSNMSEDQRDMISDSILVMGRSSPEDKLLLVQALKRKGHVVAVAGDGMDDSPALREANVALAKGIIGTRLVKESSDIIILDESFNSIVKVVCWGGSVYTNILNIIQFQVTVNVSALAIDVATASLTGEVPLNALQLLWVNLIVVTLGSLALATEPPTDHLMHRPPICQSDSLITSIIWRNVVIQVVYQLIVVLVLNFQGRNILHLQHDPTEHANKVKNTVIFNAFVFCQIFNEFNARKPNQLNIFDGVFKGLLFMGMIALALVLQILINLFLGKFTNTMWLNWQLWLTCIIIGFMSWPLALFGKSKNPILHGFLGTMLSIIVVVIFLWRL